MIKQTLLSTILCITATAVAGTYPDFAYQPPAAWDAETFVLSQDYPTMKPPVEPYPWTAIDFKTKPSEYLKAVLQYCFDGNIDADFVPSKNTKRKWFHAPWLHYGNNGREFVRGLTRERSSRPRELAAAQTQTYRNYAVGFYNDQGGHTIGQVWGDPTNPKPALAKFPEGTATFKLLFTTAPANVVTYLEGAPEWVADINRSPDVATIKATKVRLLQIDVAVKDARSSCGGWTFGTFHYDASLPGTNPWEKLRPLTLMWGNDATLTPTLAAGGQKPAEGWIDTTSPIAIYRASLPQGSPAPKEFGWAGRGNGPVDNPVSSCLSCHSTAQIPARSPMIPPSNNTEAQKLRWFRNLATNESFDTGTQSLDFSLQLGVGIQNFQSFHSMVANLGGVFHDKAKIAAPFIKSTEMQNSNTQQYRFGRDPEE